ncbi:hypothetical protein D9M71_283820 [compost metagenome]
MAGRQSAQRPAQKLKLLAGLLEASGKAFAVPVVPGVAGFHGLAILVEQAEVEIEAVGLMPAEGTRRTGKAATDRSGSVETDKIQAFGSLGDLRDHLFGVRQWMRLYVVALPAIVVEQ